MFVLNPVSHDRRVLKEASTLRVAGYDVTIIGIQLAKQPKPSHEVTPDGVHIRRVPISMVPEPWRPSPRYFRTRADRLRLWRRRGVHRLRRTLGRMRLEAIRRRHRLALETRVALRRRRPRRSIWVPRPRAAGISRARYVVRRARGGTKRWIARASRFTTSGDARRRVRLRAAAGAGRIVRRAVRRSGGPSRDASVPGRGLGTSVRRVGVMTGRIAAAVLTIPFHALFAVWAAVYLGLNHLSRGELDWALNTRQRWTSFSRQAAAVAPPAAVYHGHDFSGIGAALRARRRHGSGKVVYDSHEVYLEAGTIARRSKLLKWLLRAIERRAFREADALITVNRMVGDVLHERYGDKATVLIHNCPPRWSPGGAWPNLIREARGIPDAAPIALYQGAFTQVRGLRQMAATILEPGLEHVHLALMGFGPMQAELLAWEADPRYGGRLHVLPAVPPDDLDRWVASADVSLMPNQPETLNEVVSTPNKLFESIAAGVPVVTSDFPERRRVVLDDPLGPLGAVCDPTLPASIAAGIVSIVGNATADPTTRMDLRRRCLQAAHERWNWESEGAKLLVLYRDLQHATTGLEKVWMTS